MKNKNIVISVVIVLVVIVGLAWYASPNQNKNKEISTTSEKEIGNTSNETASISALKADEKFYDFGEISMKNGDVSKTFKVTNSSNADIFIPSLTTSCMCTRAYMVQLDGSKKGPFGMPGHGGAVPKVNETIRAGESRDIEVVFDPNAHGPAGVGRIDRFVYLEDSNGEKLQFEIKANVTP